MAWAEKKWTSWTPTVTQSGSVTATITQAIYQLDGEVCTINVRIAITGAGTTNNAIVIGGQPAAIQASANQTIIGMMQILDAGTAHYVGSLYVNGATDWRSIRDGGTTFVGADPNFALANGDFIFIWGTYRVA